MVRYSPKTIAEALYESTTSATPEQLSTALDNTVAFLAKERMLNKAEEVIKHFTALANHANKKIVANVQTRSPLDESTKKDIITMLEKRYPTYSIQLSESINTNVIGGVRILIDDLVIDYSLQNKITQLRHHIMN